MRKIFLEYSKDISKYWEFENYHHPNFDLQYLWFALCSNYDWIIVDEYEPNQMVIWCDWDIKDDQWIIKPKSKTEQEWQEYNHAYLQYYRKLWSEIPKVQISKSAYDAVHDQVKKITQEHSNFLIFTIDDTGTISVHGKNELDADDWSMIKADHERYLNFTNKQEAYYAQHPRSLNEKWMSPADSEFFSDYLTEDEMVWKRKTYNE
jgi:hypothetical protein